MTTVTISLPDSLKQFIDRQVASRGYGNVSEYFRTLLRTAQDQEHSSRLEELLVEGLQTGSDIPLNKAFWKNLRKEALRMVQEHDGKKGTKRRS
jgi:antitoxin ParD1/3/4